MKRLLFCALCATTLAGCDNVDITKYPADIQECYNTIIYNNDNCTSNKKVILQYCQCYVPKAREAAASYEQQGRLGARMGAGIFAIANAQLGFEKKTGEIADICAEKTGFICKTNKK